MAANWTIGLDIGGSEIRMALKKSGIVFRESALAAFRPGKKEYVALGNEACNLRGREPAGIRTGIALEGGRVVAESLLDMWLGRLIRLAQEEGSGKPVVLLIGASNAREADLQAVRAAILRAGGAGMSVLESDFASALGAWMPGDAGKADGAQADVMENEGTMVVDIGAYSAFASLMVGGRVVRRESLAYGLDSAAQDFRGLLRTQYAMAIGPNTSEDAFRALATIAPDRDVPPLAVDGLSLERKLPVTTLIKADTAREAIMPYAKNFGKMAASCLAHAPEELCADIQARGILLTGGGARVPMVVRAIEEATGVRCRVSSEPELAAIRGTMRVMNAPGRYGELPLEAEG